MPANCGLRPRGDSIIYQGLAEWEKKIVEMTWDALSAGKAQKYGIKFQYSHLKRIVFWYFIDRKNYRNPQTDILKVP
jgi:hypothetical protein